MAPKSQGRLRRMSAVIMIVETPQGCVWFRLGFGPIFDAEVGNALEDLILRDQDGIDG